jgi:hypothetical protein
MTQVLSEEKTCGEFPQVSKEEHSSPALINFLESLTGSEYTRKSYAERLKKFMKFLNVHDPETLLLWDSKVIENNIISFIVNCRQKQGRAQ